HHTTPSHYTLYPCRFPLTSRLLSPDPPTPELYPLSLHDALPISPAPSATLASKIARLAAPPSLTRRINGSVTSAAPVSSTCDRRSEEHTSELQSRFDLVCRLLLEKKKARMVATTPFAF